MDDQIELLFCPRCNGRDMQIIGLHKQQGSREQQLRFQCQAPMCLHKFYEDKGRWVKGIGTCSKQS